MAGRHNKFEYCTLWFCSEPHYGRGLCAKHYQNWLRTRDPLPEQADDLRVVLSVVDTFREVVSAFLRSNNAYYIVKDGEFTVESKCKFCGGSSQYIAGIKHDESCPVYLAENLLASTQTTPPSDKYTYELDLSLKGDEDNVSIRENQDQPVLPDAS
jgi:hypothetical protein